MDVSQIFRITEPFLLSTNPLSSGRRGLDLVKRINSLFNKSATVRLTYSPPLSEWNPMMWKEIDLACFPIVVPNHIGYSWHWCHNFPLGDFNLPHWCDKTPFWWSWSPWCMVSTRMYPDVPRLRFSPFTDSGYHWFGMSVAFPPISIAVSQIIDLPLLISCWYY